MRPEFRFWFMLSIGLDFPVVPFICVLLAEISVLVLGFSICMLFRHFPYVTATTAATIITTTTDDHNHVYYYRGDH